MKYPFLELGPVNAPYFGEINEAVRRVVESGRYIGGEECLKLEENLCRLTGAKYAVGVSNGLDALR
ncbi:MAG: DegT/DnrJ/EryC1/StrS family aminotransferase, partial [Muribaculaceae bacterium]|nr:DegT/DnrJ/EryC1/StrS family aminotransferase [Muribaculaceae bacterium]